MNVYKLTTEQKDLLIGQIGDGTAKGLKISLIGTRSI